MNTQANEVLQSMQVYHYYPLSSIYTISKHHVCSPGSCPCKIPCKSASHDIQKCDEFGNEYTYSLYTKSVSIKIELHAMEGKL